MFPFINDIFFKLSNTCIMINAVDLGQIENKTFSNSMYVFFKYFNEKIYFTDLLKLKQRIKQRTFYLYEPLVQKRRRQHIN